MRVMGTRMHRPGGNWSVRRPDKLADYQTVLYEIDMLRFAYAKVFAPWDGAIDGDVWVYLESFLVHYRNLLDFFGKPRSPRSRDTDLMIECPEVIWPASEGLEARRPNPDVLNRMQDIGRRLWEKYENGARRDDTISRYLQHCTTFRTSFREWFPVEMMNELKEPLELIEKHLPEFKPGTLSAPVDRNHFLGGGSVSTHSGTVAAMGAEPCTPGNSAPVTGSEKSK
jgi:hypothetical protein